MVLNCAGMIFINESNCSEETTETNGLSQRPEPRQHEEADMQTLCSFLHDSRHGCLDKEGVGTSVALSGIQVQRQLMWNNNNSGPG